MCRQCGGLVGAGEESCSACGAPSGRDAAPAEAPHAGDRETVRFLRAIISRPATFTFVFLVANVFLYLLMTFTGGATGEVLLARADERAALPAQARPPGVRAPVSWLTFRQDFECRKVELAQILHPSPRTVMRLRKQNRARERASHD